MVSLRAVVLAIAFTLGAAKTDYSPSATVNFKHAAVGSGLSAENLKGDVTLESEVSDDLKVGLEYDHGNTNAIKSMFAKITQKFGDGDVEADLKVAMDDNTLSGEIEYVNGDSTILAEINSGSKDVIESVEYTRKSTSGGLSSMFKPKFTVADKSVDIEASADLDKDTNLLVKLSEGGNVADLEVNHQLDEKTAVKVEAQLQSSGAQIEVEREIDSENSIRPRFDLNSKHLTCAWVRKLSRDRTATLTIDPDNSVEFELEADDDGDWSAKVHAPMNDMGNPDVSFGRKFSF
jgi:hypothetical protein